jgi:glycosyltransferase involved in cell wall biosynthesis
MNVIRAMKAKGHEVRVVCADQDKKGQPGYYVVPKIDFGPFNRYVQKNGVVPASKERHHDDRRSLKRRRYLPLQFLRIPFELQRSFSPQDGNSLHRLAPYPSRELHQPRRPDERPGPLTISGITISIRIFSRKSKPSIIRANSSAIFSKPRIISNPMAIVISNGIQKDFHPATYEKPKEWEGKTVITFTARYSKEKTHKVLIKALKRFPLREADSAGPLRLRAPFR